MDLLKIWLMLWSALALAVAAATSSSPAESTQEVSTSNTRMSLRDLRKMHQIRHRAKQGRRNRRVKAGPMMMDKLVKPEMTSTRRRHRQRKRHRQNHNAGQSTKSPSRTLSTKQLHERIKQRYIFMIQQKLLQGLGLSHQPNVTRPPPENIQELLVMYEKKKKEMENVSSVDHGPIAEQLRQYLPSCQEPRKTNATWWHSKESFRLYFNVQPTSGTRPRVSSGKLKLFKKIQPGPGLEQSTQAPSNKRTSSSRSTSESTGTQGQTRTLTTPGGYSSTTQPPGDDETMANDEEIDAFQTLRVSVFQYKYKARRNRPWRKQLVDSQMINRDTIGYVTLNIRAPVEEWLRKPFKNFGLEIVVEEENTKKVIDPRTVFHGPKCDDSDTVDLKVLSFNMTEGGVVPALADPKPYPALELLVSETPKPDKLSRPKRNSGKRKKHTCRLEKLYVDFHDLGWEFVIAPTGFWANYCTGQCMGVAMNKKFSLPPSACCGASKRRPLTVIYANEKGLVALALLRDMVVEECECKD